ncbi:alkane 1-monooxygenase [Rhodobacterales bacterium HKCCE2091]|nr:alkane 1-monooxygenase [Rhodobacterales bacterium HKCCE2091]
MDTTGPNSDTRLGAALPFWAPILLLPPILAFAAAKGGAWFLLVPAASWWLFILLDAALGRNPVNADPATDTARLRWHRMVTFAWVPIQAVMLFGLVAYVPRAPHLSVPEAIGLAAAAGTLTGTIGINYAHELMHQRPRFERRLADMLLAMVLYGHFRSEHLLVHHTHVGTPRDTVTAPLGEGFWRFLRRVVAGGPVSAFRAETAKLARAGRPWWHRSNPFWTYAALEIGCLLLAIVLGGALGLMVFVVQAAFAILQLELVNYVEHYGLSRRRLADGRYEPAGPHHSWNATQTASNWLLINLQRHSDHHMKPDRRYPLLQTRAGEAPELPAGYPVMVGIALVPPLWHRVMGPRVRAWRRRHYPDVADWTGA